MHELGTWMLLVDLLKAVNFGAYGGGFLMQESVLGKVIGTRASRWTCAFIDWSITRCIDSSPVIMTRACAFIYCQTEAIFAAAPSGIHEHVHACIGRERV